MPVGEWGKPGARGPVEVVGNQTVELFNFAPVYKDPDGNPLESIDFDEIVRVTVEVSGGAAGVRIKLFRKLGPIDDIVASFVIAKASAVVDIHGPLTAVRGIAIGQGGVIIERVNTFILCRTEGR